MKRTSAVGLAAILVVSGLSAGAGYQAQAQGPTKTLVDQGLNPSEEAPFRKSLKTLLKDRDTDMVITVRRSKGARGGCRKSGLVYWVYSARGTICFTRKPKGPRWAYKVQVVRGKNPIRRQSATALATLAAEREASTFLEDPERRNLIKGSKVTYPYAYERIVAELDGPRAGDFIIVPRNTSDRGSKGAHGHLGLAQSRSTFLIAGRGARRSPLSAKAEARLSIKHPDIAPTVASALGINPYFADTKEPAHVLNGKESTTALLERQDGRVLKKLLEPTFNTFVVSIDGLRPEDVTEAQMPNLTGLLAEPCEAGGTCATAYNEARASMVTETNGNHTAMITGAYGEDSGIIANETFDRETGA
ncbi:MAG TPA: alkaline phosphatase family protein, partial [Actinomycetota bacterium]|nr:alkaline phosphatase family protein [Actinomycetota bacterium]